MSHEELPRHLGRETATETGYALVCNAVKSGDQWTGALCGKPAVRHLRWRSQDTENGFACPAHIDYAMGFDPYDHHSVGDSACGMPGSFWVDGDPSHCTLLALDDEPDRSGHVALEVSRD